MQTDPSLSKFFIFIILVNGFRIVFERPCPFELNLEDPDVVARVGRPIVS